MIRGAAALALAALLAACAGPRGAEAPFAFAVMGDVPYSAEEERLFEAMLRDIDRERLAFVAHVGDFRGGNEACSDALFARRRAQLDAMRHAVVFTPGDNEWADCARGDPPFDPLERLARLRELFFATDATLGARPLTQHVQRGCLAPPVEGCGCAAHPENRTWTIGRVRFVTVNLSGSRNNVGYSAATDREARCRDVANARWIAEAAREARAESAVAMVILTQANPWWTRGDEFAPFLGSVRAAAAELARPVLLVHGDTHVYRADFPFRDAFGEALPHLSRLETWGSPFIGWVKVWVDPSRPDPFAFEPRLAAVTIPWWYLGR